MRRRRLALVGAVLGIAACVERVTAPGQCPDFCPSGKITVVDTLLATGISGDSAFRGYVLAHEAALMLATHLPGATDTLEGRAIFRIDGLGSRFAVSATDTGDIRGADSARLRLVVTRRDTATHHTLLHLYRLPITIDSNTTFNSVATAFTADSLLRTVNIDNLLAQPGNKDPVTGDSVVSNDSVSHQLVLSLKLDPPAARYVPTDSGTVAYGIGVTADSLVSIALGKGTLGPVLQWYLQVDSLGRDVARTPSPSGAAFASFVFAPPAAAPDSTLAVGGVPSARSLLRVAFPKSIRDSSQVVRGTLILVPAVPARGAPADSFVIEARTVFSDFGRKSPVDLRLGGATVIRPDSTGTVRIDVTSLLQLWASDSTHPTTIVLMAQAEAQSLGEIRFYPSIAAALRPTLQVTFARRFPFGAE